MVKKKVSLGKLEINFTNRSVYTLIAFFSILVLGVGVYAIGATPNPGHSIIQLQPCDSGQILETVGGSWACVAKPSGGGGESLWTDGGSDIYRLPSRVGIGTSTPSQKLTIFVAPGAPATSGSTQSGGSQIRLEQSGDNTVLDFGVIAGSGRGSWLQSTDKSNLATNYPLLLNPNGGSVGIGTSSPLGGTKLHVNGGATHFSTLSPSNPMKVYIMGSTGGSDGIVSFMNTNRADVSFQDNIGLTLSATTGTSAPTITNGLRISTAGKVGIGGSPNPNAKLYVSGSVTIGSSYSATSVPDNGALIQGNVGIGTTAPVAKLEVNNNLRLTPTSSAPYACDSTKRGAMYYNSGGTGTFYGCATNGWTALNGDGF